MKSVKLILFLCWGCIIWLGCGKTYQSISADSLGTQLSGHEGQRHGDFLQPMPYNEGQWRLVVNGVSCMETVNFENQPRIRSMLQMAASARKENRPIRISGVVKEGKLDIEYFEGMRTDTAWHKDKNPYYSYAAYYEWSPFAYSPNARVFRFSRMQ
ncbi:hypothetical protein J4G02_16265 [Candidatus Poribacteria bacterium]|nr:hypothetical protein [Candidatus Poribacteria bacterium]